MSIYVSDIDWDTDGEDIPDLPDEVEIPVDDIIDPRDIEEDDINVNMYEDDISDWLSDRYGWCVNTFFAELRKEE